MGSFHRNDCELTSHDLGFISAPFFDLKISGNINFETISNCTEKWRLKLGAINSLWICPPFGVDWVGLKEAGML